MWLPKGNGVARCTFCLFYLLWLQSVPYWPYVKYHSLLFVIPITFSALYFLALPDGFALVWCLQCSAAYRTQNLHYNDSEHRCIFNALKQQQCTVLFYAHIRFSTFKCRSGCSICKCCFVWRCLCIFYVIIMIFFLFSKNSKADKLRELRGQRQGCILLIVVVAVLKKMCVCLSLREKYSYVSVITIKKT